MVSGGLKVGQVTMAFKDISFPDMGFSLSLDREYDSRAQGLGWNLAQSEVKADVTNVLGEGWMQQFMAGRFGIPVYYLIGTQRHMVVIRFSDTDVVKSDMKLDPVYSELMSFEQAAPPVVRPHAGSKTNYLIRFDNCASIRKEALE